MLLKLNLTGSLTWHLITLTESWKRYRFEDNKNGQEEKDIDLKIIKDKLGKKMDRKKKI
jgi:hypothetical protein